MYLTGQQEQKRRAVQGSFNPTIVSLYSDADIARANPFIGDLVDVFTNAVARPATVTGQNYNKVSSEFFNAAHQVLSGRAQPEQALAGLERELKRTKRGGWKQ
jgi:trehalose/maltose transport system substrate-binding protein